MEKRGARVRAIEEERARQICLTQPCDINNASFFPTATRQDPLFHAMTCVAGDSKYNYYPSPAPSISSSPEGAQAPMASHATPRVSSAAAPVSVPVQTGASGRAANGLHTPAASDDFRGKNLGGTDEVRSSIDDFTHPFLNSQGLPV
jgi:hypothetical protein